MSWQDRDYNHQAQFGAGIAGRFHRPPPGVGGLMVLHAVGFVLMQVLQSDAGEQVAQWAVLSGQQLRALAIVLHPFAGTGRLINDLLSLAFVLFVLYGLGSMIERRYGTRRLVVAYVVCNLAAGLAFYLVARVSPMLAIAPLVTPIGVMAGWVWTAWRRFQDEMVSVLGKVTSVGKVVAIVAGVLIALHLVQFGPAAGGWLVAVVVGGLAVGLADRLAEISLARADRVAAAAPRRSRPAHVVEDTEVDRILAKISREGMDALTRAERRRLERARREKLRSGR